MTAILWSLLYGLSLKTPGNSANMEEVCNRILMGYRLSGFCKKPMAKIPMTKKWVNINYGSMDIYGYQHGHFPVRICCQLIHLWIAFFTQALVVHALQLASCQKVVGSTRLSELQSTSLSYMTFFFLGNSQKMTGICFFLNV